MHLITAREEERRLYANRPLILFYRSPVKPIALLDINPVFLNVIQLEEEKEEKKLFRLL